jgi:hypothetical protein
MTFLKGNNLILLMMLLTKLLLTILNVLSDGAKGNGTCTILANKRFLREQQKFYHLPIIMRDMGGNINHRSGTSTLTIEIGDKNNNQHTDGFKEIFVYNYKGKHANILYSSGLSFGITVKQ